MRILCQCSQPLAIPGQICEGMSCCRYLIYAVSSGNNGRLFSKMLQDIAQLAQVKPNPPILML